MKNVKTHPARAYLVLWQADAIATAADGSNLASVSTSGRVPVEYDAATLLFILATNFLLYVALVLITYLVVKLYIQSAPENPLFEEATTYQRVPATHSGLELTSMSVQVRFAVQRSGTYDSAGNLVRHHWPCISAMPGWSDGFAYFRRFRLRFTMIILGYCPRVAPSDLICHGF